jgi:hypothetical protein
MSRVEPNPNSLRSHQPMSSTSLVSLSHSTLRTLVRSLLATLMLIALGTSWNARAEIRTEFPGSVESLIQDGRTFMRAWVDVNGDGRTDYCRNLEWTGPDSDKMVCYYSSVDAQGQRIWSQPIVAPGVQWGDIAVRKWADIDGDGIPEFCSINGDRNQTRTLMCYRWTGVPDQPLVPAIAGISISQSVQRELIDFPDVNGDGRADICYPLTLLGGNPDGTDRTDLTCFYSTGSTDYRLMSDDTLTFWVGNNIEPGLTGRARQWADVDGDGRADFCRAVGTTADQRIRCLMSGPNGFTRDVLSHTLNSSVTAIDGWGFNDGASFVDVNGDGKSDYCRIISTVANQFSLRCTLSTGDGWARTVPQDAAWERWLSVAEANFGSTPLDPGHAQFRWWVDVNGDGQADFCRAVGGDPEKTTSTMSCRLASGNRFAFSDILIPGIGFGQAGSRSWCDANGDGIQEYCRTGRMPNDAGLIIHAGLPNAPTPQVLHQYRDGLNSNTIITYLPLTDDRVYGKRLEGSTETTSGYPRQLLVQPATPVVFETIAQRNDGTRLTGRSTYRYEELRTDTWGHGSRGFRKRVMVNQGNNTREETLYFQGRGAVHGGGSIENDFREVGLVQSKRTTLLTGLLSGPDMLSESPWARTARIAAKTSLGTSITGDRATSEISRVVNTLADTTEPLQSGQVGHPGHRYIGRSEIRAWDLNGALLPSKVTVTQQDAFGNVTRIEETTRSANITQADQVYVRTTVNTYRPADLTNWILGRLDTATVTSTAPSADTQIAKYATSAGSAPLATATTIAPHTITVSGGGSVVQTRTSSGAFSATATASVTANGLAPFSFSWTRTVGSRISVANAQTATATFSLASLNPGESLAETFRVTVTDATGRAVSQDVPVRFGWLNASVTPSPVTASRVGTGSVSATATASASGGTSGYAFAWTAVSANGITIANANTATATFTAASVAAGTTTTGTFRVTATDARSVATTRDVTVNLTANWPPLVANLSTATANGSRVGTGAVSASATATASGGSGGYTYAWSAIAANGISIVNGSSATASFSANVNAGQTVSGTFRVTVTDSRGTPAQSSVLTVTLTAEWPPLVAGITASTVSGSRVDTGAVSASATATASGGSGGYTYAWSAVNANGISIVNGSSPTASFSANVNAGQTVSGTFRVTVTDSRGTNAASGNITVSLSAEWPPLSIVSSPSSGTATVVGGGIASISLTAQGIGGSGGYTYAWGVLSGDGFTLTNQFTPTVTISRSIAAGQSAVGVFRAAVFDSRGLSSIVDVTVSFDAPFAPLVVSASPNPVSTTRDGSGFMSAQTALFPSGGSGGYTYSWTPINQAGFTIVNPDTANPVFWVDFVAGGTTRTSVWRGTVRDSRGVSASVDVTVNISATLGPPQVSVAPAPVSGSRVFSGSSSNVTATGTVTVVDGRAPYSFAWTQLSGIALTIAGTTNPTFTGRVTLPCPSNIGSAFSRYRLTVTDADGRTGSTDFDVSLMGEGTCAGGVPR